ncbi:MAG: hypothetical protein RL630_1752 [Verrucomicrobiota bacterium]|jgi:hypothetical protein
MLNFLLMWQQLWQRADGRNLRFSSADFRITQRSKIMQSDDLPLLVN